MEIEAKILEVDVAAVRRKLKALGAHVTFDGTHEAYVFDDDERSINNTKRLVRLRREIDRGAERVTFTFKRKLSRKGVVRAVEYETTVGSLRATRDILAGLGLHVRLVVRKRREEYTIGKTHYCLDTPQGVPTYLEIEAPSKRAVEAAARELGFGPDDLKPWSLMDVRRHYGVPIREMHPKKK